MPGLFLTNEQMNYEPRQQCSSMNGGSKDHFLLASHNVSQTINEVTLTTHITLTDNLSCQSTDGTTEYQWRVQRQGLGRDLPLMSLP